MPNICNFELRARGTRDATDELLMDMCPPDDQPERRHMARVFDVDVISTQHNPDGTVTVHAAGGCAWSALVCMTRENKYCYGFDQPWFIGLEDEALERGLYIEVHSLEPAMGFAERIICTPDNPLSNESFPADELSYDPEDGDTPADLDWLVEKYDLTDDERRRLEDGEYLVKSDLDFDEWSI